MLTDLYAKGTLRTLPEEFNLCTNMHHHDATSAEYLRSYQIREFNGSAFLALLEREVDKQRKDRTDYCVIPVPKRNLNHANSSPLSWPALYGYRGTDHRIFYLSPWEFHMQPHLKVAFHSRSYFERSNCNGLA